MSRAGQLRRAVQIAREDWERACADLRAATFTTEEDWEKRERRGPFRKLRRLALATRILQDHERAERIAAAVEATNEGETHGLL